MSLLDAETLRQRIQSVRAHINEACARAGRDPAEVTLIGVTKTHTPALVAAAVEAGLDTFGENRVQELQEKAGQMPGHAEGGAVTWHLIGHLQRNKAKFAVQHADWFHALDSPRLAAELDKRAAAVDRTLNCLVQVNVSGEASKFGLEPDDVEAFAATLDQYPLLHIRGLMTLAAPADDPEDVRPQFRLLRALRDRLSEIHGDKGTWEHLSMGMSGDYAVAVEEGATMVRVGSALFGARS